MPTPTVCRFDGTPLVVKETKRTADQLKKPYYYTAYYFCPTCKRMYLSDDFKETNDNFNLFTSKSTLTPGEVDIEIWTDGASSNNGRPEAKAAWAFVAGNYEEAGQVDGKQTNNRGEALAIFYALTWAAGKGYKRIRIHTDSQITLHGVAKNPELVKENRDIFQRIHDVIIQNTLEVEYVKVLGHSGDENNERADKLAVKQTLA